MRLGKEEKIKREGKRGEGGLGDAVRRCGKLELLVLRKVIKISK